jgi:hypothetical protein
MTYDGLWKTELGNCLMLLKHSYVITNRYRYNLYTRMQCKVISGKYNGTGLVSVLPTRNITLAVMDTRDDMCVIYVRQRGAR